MVKLSKKTKSSNTDKALRQIVKLQADAHGMSVSEFKKKRDTILQSQKEYEKTHWVSNLTDAQKYFIATSETPQHYMRKPLSKSN